MNSEEISWFPLKGRDTALICSKCLISGMDGTELVDDLTAFGIFQMYIFTVLFQSL